MNNCRFCGVSGTHTLVSQGIWLDKEKIYICDTHLTFMSDKRRVNVVHTNYYFKDQTYEFAARPPEKIYVSKQALMQIFLCVKRWTLMAPPYPRKSPIENIFLNIKHEVNITEWTNIYMCLLYIHWIYENEHELDYEEYNFFNPCDSSMFDTDSMQDYQDHVTKCVHQWLKVL